MITYILPLLQIDVTEKLKNAPDGNYEIGVIIGSLLPFALFAAIAWYAFYKMKNRNDLDD